MKIITLSNSKYDYLLEGLSECIELEDIMKMIIDNTTDLNENKNYDLNPATNPILLEYDIEDQLKLDKDDELKDTNNKVSNQELDSGIVALAHQQGLKVYHCGNSICMSKSCKKGHEIAEIIFGEQQYTKIDVGRGFKMIPTIKEAHIFYYVDGTEKIVESFDNIIYNGCEEVEPLD